MIPLQPIKVAIADDHALFRKGLFEILSGFQEIEPIMEAGTGKELLEKIAAAKIKPEVCILDINMPVMNGYDTAKALREKYKKIKLLALSMYDNESNIIKMLRSGAHGYVLKDVEPDQLRNAIVSIFQDGYYHSDLITNDILRASKGSGEPELALTQKELAFLKYSCSDLTYKEIADQMGLSHRTVEGYRDILFEKLNVRSRTGLALYAVKNGLVAIY
jgi:two-component system invasion response regulator UvrY